MKQTPLTLQETLAHYQAWNQAEDELRRRQAGQKSSEQKWREYLDMMEFGMLIKPEPSPREHRQKIAMQNHYYEQIQRFEERRRSMKNGLLDVLNEVIRVLQTHGYRYAVIGGIANQIWGQARFTYDLDIKVLVPDTNYEAVRSALSAEFPKSGRPDLPLNPLILSVKINGVIVDFLFTTPGYEEQIVTRATQMVLADMTVWVCSAEDLIIQKALANRSKDWQDIEGILLEQGERLQHDYLEEWLTQFADILEKPEIVTRYRHLRTLCDG